MPAGRTIVEAILSRASGREARAGDVVVCDVDTMLAPDASAPMTLDYFERMGGTSVFAPERIVFAMDHYAPPPSAASANHHRRMRAFAAEHGISVCEVGEGIGHQRLLELGRALPGQVVIGADSHTVTFGALNAFATGIGSSDLAAAMITGRVWLRVPRTIRVELVGHLAPDVSAKDIVLYLLEHFGADGADYRSLEFCGPGVDALELADRLVLANMSVEMGAKCGLFRADAIVHDYLATRTYVAYEGVEPDDDAVYEHHVRVDLDAIAPSVARPHRVDSIDAVSVAAGVRVDMVFVGTCTGGRVEDFHAFRNAVLRGGGIASDVTVVLTPASRDVLAAIIADGTLSELVAMGAVLTTPGCGACCGTSGAIPSDGMTVVSTANRNFKGRMGNATASIYLASPQTCGASAATGVITDPRAVPS